MASLNRNSGRHFLLVLASLLGLFLPASVFAQSCAAQFSETIVESKIATADSWPNLMKREGSISFESERMLKKIETSLSSATPPQLSCPASCKISAKPKIIFSSIPNAYLSDYSDKQRCDTLFQQTKASPLLFSGKSFDSLDKFNSWSSDFSQGKGSEGSALYRKCDGSCSPQYYYYLSVAGQAKAVEASVLCGPARDKSDNKYRLAIGYRWECEAI